MLPDRARGHLCSSRARQQRASRVLTGCFVLFHLTDALISLSLSPPPPLRASCSGGSPRPSAARTGRSQATRSGTAKGRGGARPPRSPEEPSSASSLMVMDLVICPSDNVLILSVRRSLCSVLKTEMSMELFKTQPCCLPLQLLRKTFQRSSGCECGAST